MIEKAVLVGGIDEAKDIIAHIRARQLDPSQSVIIGHTLMVRALLTREGIECVDTIAYLDNAAHTRAVRGTQGVGEWIRDEFTLDLDDGLVETYKEQFSIMVLCNLRHCIATIEILHNVMRLHPECTTIVCSEVPASRSLTRICRSFCDLHGLAIELLAPPGSGAVIHDVGESTLPKKPGLAMIFVAYCYSIIAWRLGRRGSVLLYSGGKMVSLIRSLIQRYPQSGTIYLRYYPYSVVQELARALFWLLSLSWGGRVGQTYLSVPTHAMGDWLGRQDRARTGEIISASIRAFFDRHGDRLQYRGIPCGDAIRIHAEHPRQVFHRYHNLALGVAHLLDRLQPSLVLSASGGQEHQIVGELSKKMGIRSVFISMKSLSNPAGELEQLGAHDICEVVMTEVHPIAVAQSEQELGYMQRTGYTGQIIPSGPLLRTRVGTVQRNEARQRMVQERSWVERILLYAPSMKSFEAFYSIQTLDEVVSSMSDLVQTVERMPGTCLILRLHPGYADLAPDLPYLFDLGTRTIIDTGTYDSIEHVLSLADLVVSNSSTVAEEAVCNGIPVILYDKWARYNHLAAPVVIGPHPESLSPVYYVPSQAQLDTSVAWVLANHPVGTSFPEALMDKYIYADARSRAFYDFVGQAVGASPQQGAQQALTDAE